MNSKQKELLLYVFFGGLTVGVNLGVYRFLRSLRLSVSNATLLAWSVAMLFAFYTNRNYVFSGVDKKKQGLIKEFVRFLSSRIGTLIIEMIVTLFLIEYLAVNEWFSKIAIQGIVIVSNYLLSKTYVFK